MVEVDEKIIKETTKCNWGMECLGNENHVCQIAKIVDCVNGKVHFVNCDENNCKYKLGFGDSKICICPVKIEIFNKHKKQIPS